MTIKIYGSEAEGLSKATGQNTHAEGNKTTASGNNSHAEGDSSTASGTASHAEGYSTASAQYAHAEGYNTTASGSFSHAEGNQSKATGSSSHAEGLWALADAYGAYARSGASTSAINNAARAQHAVYTLGNFSNSTAPILLSFDGGTSVNAVFTGNANVLMVPTFATYLFNLTLVSRRVGVALSSHAWQYAGVIARDSSSTRIIGAVTQIGTWQDVSNGTVSITAGTNYLSIQANPVNAPIAWHGVLTVNEFVVTS